MTIQPKGDGVPQQGSVRAAEGMRQLRDRTAGDTRREDRVVDTLAAYYKAVGRAERIRVAARRKVARVITTARRKADAITSGAERDAAVPDAEAAGLMRDLLGLVGGKAEVAELCGLSVKGVSDVLAGPPRAAESAASGAPAHGVPVSGVPVSGAGEDSVSAGKEDDDDGDE